MTPETTPPARKPRKSRSKKVQPESSAVASAAPSAPSPAPAVPPTAPAPARRTGRTLLEQRATSLLWFLRRHAEKPYGLRGCEAIWRHAVEVGHLANLALGAR